MSKELEAGKEPLAEWLSSFVGFLILMLVFKTFLIQLFVIPTGSMAETLFGAHTEHACAHCGFTYPVGYHVAQVPTTLRCPNCWHQEPYLAADRSGMRQTEASRRDQVTYGDRIAVLGWPYDLNRFGFGPRRWDVVVFRYPDDPSQNYIKRLVGLPGETVEIVDGDLFVNGQISRKPSFSQRDLWIPVYQHDFAPTEIGDPTGTYFPRWAASPASAWSGLASRQIAFDASALAETDAAAGASIHFTTDPDDPDQRGVITDLLAYNAPLVARPGDPPEPAPTALREPVSDVRLSATIDALDAGAIDFVLAKYDQRVTLRLDSDGQLALFVAEEVSEGPDATTALRAAPDLGTAVVTLDAGNLVGAEVSLGIVDYAAVVALDGRVVVEEALPISLDVARTRAVSSAATAQEIRSRVRSGMSAEEMLRIADAAVHRRARDRAPLIAITGRAGRALLSGLRIDRDMHYRSVDQRLPTELPGIASTHVPFTLNDSEFLVFGDNSASSLDSRLWIDRGPHLQTPAYAGYQIGVVPRDQLVGRAFFVYWPSAYMLLPQDGPLGGLRLLLGVPKAGRVRWIQ